MASILVRIGIVVLLVAAGIGIWDSRRKGSTPKFTNAKPREKSKYARARAFTDHQPLKGKKALVTGANGFLGANLVESLCMDDWEVLAMHRKGSDVTTLNDVQAAQRNCKLKLVEGDVTDYKSLEAAVPEDLPVVFHVAAAMKFSFLETDVMYETNVLGTRNVVDICLQKNVGKLVHTSTVGVYFSARESVLTGTFSETSPQMAEFSWTGYTHTKYLAEKEVRAGIEDGLWATIVNPAGIVGRYDTTGFARVAVMLKKKALPGVAESAINIYDARAYAEMHIEAAKKGRLGENYIVCGPESVSFSEIVREVGNQIGVNGDLPKLPAFVLNLYGTINDIVSSITKKVPDVTAEIAHTATMQMIVCDSSKAQRELGLKHTIPWKKSLKDSMDWLKAKKRI